jgi:hypothetical protein
MLGGVSRALLTCIGCCEANLCCGVLHFCAFLLARCVHRLAFLALLLGVFNGLQAVIYAATCDWAADQRKRKDGSPLQPAEDLRYYARGVFTWPQVC